MFASAQNAGHDLEIRLPILLKLSLDGQLADQHAEVPLTISVECGIYEIIPAQTQLKVLSNTSWQLSIETHQKASNPGVNLNYRLDEHKDWQPVRTYTDLVRQGRGSVHSAMVIRYGLSNIPPDGIYQMVVAYTLTNP
jgi:hypothetical protein